MRLAAIGVAFAAAVALGVAPAVRAEGSIVVIAAADPGAVEVARLERELRALGFAPRVEQTDPEGRAGLEEVARRADAVAAIAIVPSVRGAEVWVADRVTGKVTLRDVIVTDEDDQGVTLALRAVELLRASLMELRAPHPSRGEIPASPVVERLAPANDASGAFDFEASAVVSVVPDGLVAWHVALGVGWMPHPIVGLHVTVLVPVAPARASGPEGEADVYPTMLGGGIRLRASLGGHFRVQADGGLAAVVLATTGRAIPPYMSGSDTVYAAVPYLRGALSWAVTSSLWLDANLTVGVAAPRLVLTFAGREVAAWGRPVVLAGLGIGIDL